MSHIEKKYKFSREWKSAIGNLKILLRFFRNKQQHEVDCFSQTHKIRRWHPEITSFPTRSWNKLLQGSPTQIAAIFFLYLLLVLFLLSSQPLIQSSPYYPTSQGDSSFHSPPSSACFTSPAKGTNSFIQFCQTVAVTLNLTDNITPTWPLGTACSPPSQHIPGRFSSWGSILVDLLVNYPHIFNPNLLPGNN